MFKESGQSPGLPVELLEYHSDFFTDTESEFLLHKFIVASAWKQKVVKMYDKEVITQRLSAWYADAETYDYTSLHKSAPNVWTSELLMIKEKVEVIAWVKFNSVSDRKQTLKPLLNSLISYMFGKNKDKTLDWG